MLPTDATGHPKRVLDVIEQARKRTLAKRSSAGTTQQVGFDLPLGGPCSLPSRNVNREADGESDQNIVEKDDDMLEVANEQGVVGRNEEEIDDKIGDEGGRQRRPQAANHRGHRHRDEIEEYDGGQTQRPANRHQRERDEGQTDCPTDQTRPDAPS
jgi:hypothetical protein